MGAIIRPMAIKEYLLIPGPTPIPPRVMQAMHRPMVAHRGSEFSAIVKEVSEGLKWAFQTTNEAYMIPGTGTAGMEAAVESFFSPGEKVIVLDCGAFGTRWTKIAKAYNLQVTDVVVPRGKPATPDLLKDAFARAGNGVKAVLYQHNETSTGVLNNVSVLSEIAQQNGAWTVVDAISGLLSAPLAVDELGLDIVIAGSQKAFMIPPGLAFVTASARAWEAYPTAKNPKFYLDLGKYRSSLKDSTTPTTAAVSLVFGLQESLKMLQEEGLPSIQGRHDRLMRATRAGIRALGLTLFADDLCASKAVTAVLPPEGVAADDIRKQMKKEHGVVLAGGQVELKGKIFRIGHLGYVDSGDILHALSGLEKVLTGFGVSIKEGVAVERAKEALAA